MQVFFSISLLNLFLSLSSFDLTRGMFGSNLFISENDTISNLFLVVLPFDIYLHLFSICCNITLTL